MAIQSGNYGHLLEPIVRKWFWDYLKEYPEEFSRVFKVNNSKKAIETDARLGGFGLWDKKGTMDSTQYADLPPELALQYIHETYSKGFVVEREMVDDEQWSLIKKLPASLARGARASIETLAANVLNTAFTNTGYDGVSLANASHPRLDKGTAVSNLASGTLTDANLKLAMIQAHEQVDDAGILVQMMPKLLVVPPQLEFTAKTIVGSANLSPNGNGTLSAGVSNAATDKNVLQNGLQVVVMHYLQPLDGSNNPSVAGTNYPWFLIDPTISELNFFWRERLSFKSENDFDTDQYKYKGRYRCSVGYSDFRGIIASPGH